MFSTKTFTILLLIGLSSVYGMPYVVSPRDTHDNVVEKPFNDATGSTFVGSNDECDFSNECGNGFCITTYTLSSPNGTEKTCLCAEGYVDYEGGVCNEQKLRRTSAFAMSFIFGLLGGDYFYMARGSSEYNGLGSFCLIMLVISAILKFISQSSESSSSTVCGLFGYVIWVGLFVWWIVRWIQIVAGPCYFKDGMDICLTQ